MIRQIVKYREDCSQQAGVVSLDVSARAEQQTVTKGNEQKTDLS